MLKILLADDHSIVRSGLKIIIKQDYGAEIDEASNGNEVMQCIRKNKYDLVVLDINMPETNSPVLIENIHNHSPATKILIFSMNPEHIYAKRYFKMGANGYLSKEASDEETHKAIRTVLADKRYASPKVIEQLVDEALHNVKENPFEKLSAREFEVVLLLIQGKNLAEITNTLNIHSSTIGTHKAHIFEKLDVQNLIELNELAKLYQIA